MGDSVGLAGCSVGDGLAGGSSVDGALLHRERSSVESPGAGADRLSWADWQRLGSVSSCLWWKLSARCTGQSRAVVRVLAFPRGSVGSGCVECAWRIHVIWNWSGDYPWMLFVGEGEVEEGTIWGLFLRVVVVVVVVVALARRFLLCLRGLMKVRARVREKKTAYSVLTLTPSRVPLFPSCLVVTHGSRPRCCCVWVSGCSGRVLVTEESGSRFFLMVFNKAKSDSRHRRCRTGCPSLFVHHRLIMRHRELITAIIPFSVQYSTVPPLKPQRRRISPTAPAKGPSTTLQSIPALNGHAPHLSYR